MDTVDINSGDWSLVVDLEGGRIVSLKNKQILILGSFERIDGKRGNTHICVPNFANDGVEKYGLPFHGLFRNAKWLLFQKLENLLEIECETGGFNVHQIFSFNNDEYFSQKIVIENRNEEEKPVNVAVHNYWSSDLGWEGLMLNDVDLSLGIKQSDFINLRPINELNVPGKPLIKWQVIGFKYAKLWTGFLEEGNSKIFDNNYFCLEPIMEKNEEFFGSPDSMLMPNKKIELRQMIGLVNKNNGD